MTLSKIVIITVALSAQLISGESWSDTPENKDNQEAAGNRYQNTSLMAKTAKQRLGKNGLTISALIIVKCLYNLEAQNHDQTNVTLQKLTKKTMYIG